MRVLVYATGADTGGQGWRIAQAFARHAPDWTLDAVNASRSPLGFEEQYPIPIRDRQALIARLYAEADVVHLRNNLSGWDTYDRGRCLPTILHHHGSQFRKAPLSLAKECERNGIRQVAATLDLTLLAPNVDWVPSPYDVDELSRLREHHDDGIVRIAYFPTAARIKSAGAFMAAYRQLAQKYRLELLTNLGSGDRVFHKPWQDVLAQKAKADILFDQVILGYGNNAIESWAIGTPVIAGVEDPKVRALMVERFGELPFVEATESTIRQVLERLIQSAQMRKEYAERGQAHVRRFHDYPVVVKLLQEIYSTTEPTHAPTPTPRELIQQAHRDQRIKVREAIAARQARHRRAA